MRQNYFLDERTWAAVERDCWIKTQNRVSDSFAMAGGVVGKGASGIRLFKLKKCGEGFFFSRAGFWELSEMKGLIF